VYTAPGAYDAVLVITDDGGATGSDSVAITVTQSSQNELHVQDQSVSREQLNRRNWQGVTTILITDQNNQPVADVLVTVNYYGPNQGQTSGLTRSDGTVTLYTDRQRNPNGAWCFDIVDVAKDGYIYNTSANVFTSLCE